jgi:hypothetical protein
VAWVNEKVDSVTGQRPLFSVEDPTMVDPRIPAWLR